VTKKAEVEPVETGLDFGNEPVSVKKFISVNHQKFFCEEKKQKKIGRTLEPKTSSFAYINPITSPISVS
jgi:hypothetical protein